jgi:7-keto-8-aminopelargonate synthetase-like enzyme
MNMPTRAIESPVGAEVVIDGRRYVNFGGSSYLGLSGHPDIQRAGIEALREAGTGYQAPREFSLATRAHLALEREASEFFGCESALYFSSGYFFGLLALAAVRAEFGAVFFDEWAHYSLREAIAVSGLPSHAFRHLDVDDLQLQLARNLRAQQRPLVVTDALFATFGELAPLDDYVRVVTALGGKLVVDESHSFGVLGATGRGAREHYGIEGAAALVGGSTCKALGAVGGIIPATAAEIAALRATPAGRGASVGLPAGAAMCAASLRRLREHPELLQRLRANIAYLKRGLRTLGLAVTADLAPVATFATTQEGSMQALQAQLMADGIYVFHTTYIGASAAGVIRCGIFADHTTEHLDCLLDALRRHL